MLIVFLYIFYKKRATDFLRDDVCLNSVFTLNVFETTSERGHFKWITREVSDSIRSKVRLNIREQMQKTLPARIEFRKAQQEVKSAIATDDYQKSDVVEGLANVCKASFELQSFMHAQMVDNLQELSPDERREVVSFMMRLDRMNSSLHRRPSERSRQNKEITGP